MMNHYRRRLIMAVAIALAQADLDKKDKLRAPVVPLPSPVPRLAPPAPVPPMPVQVPVQTAAALKPVATPPQQPPQAPPLPSAPPAPTQAPPLAKLDAPAPSSPASVPAAPAEMPPEMPPQTPPPVEPLVKLNIAPIPVPPAAAVSMPAPVTPPVPAPTPPAAPIRDELIVTLPESVLSSERVRVALSNLKATSCKIDRSQAHDIEQAMFQGRQYRGVDDLLALAGGADECSGLKQFLQGLGVKMFDKYEIVSLLGMGSYGYTVLVQDETQNKFAIKGSGEHWTNFLTVQEEADRQRAFAALNLAPRVYEVEEVVTAAGDSLTFVRMDVVDLIMGPVLEAACEADLGPLVVQLLDACVAMIERLSNANLFHGDYHIGNIGLLRIGDTPNFKVCVIDFGRAVLNFSSPYAEGRYFLEMLQGRVDSKKLTEVCLGTAQNLYLEKFPKFEELTAEDWKRIHHEADARWSESRAFQRLAKLEQIGTATTAKLAALEQKGLAAVVAAIRSSNLVLNEKPLNPLVRAVYRSSGVAADGTEQFDVDALGKDFVEVAAGNPSLYFVETEDDITGVFLQFLENKPLIIILKFPVHNNGISVYRTLNKNLFSVKNGAIYLSPGDIFENSQEYANSQNLGYFFDPFSELASVNLQPSKMEKFVLILNCVTRVKNSRIRERAYIVPFNVVESMKTIVQVTNQLETLMA